MIDSFGTVRSSTEREARPFTVISGLYSVPVSALFRLPAAGYGADPRLRTKTAWFSVENISAQQLTLYDSCDNIYNNIFVEVTIMEHIKTIETRNLCESAKNGGCGECQTSCQSACKTSCGIANQQCENTQSK